MWLLALMILIMPYESSPYLYIAPNFLGVFPDFTVIKLLGLAGFAWAVIRLAGGHAPGALLSSGPAGLLLLFFCGVLFAALLGGRGTGPRAGAVLDVLARRLLRTSRRGHDLRLPQARDRRRRHGDGRAPARPHHRADRSGLADVDGVRYRDARAGRARGVEQG